MKSATWVKMLVGGVVTCVGGPALVMWVTPSEEQLRARYNPELRKRAEETAQQKQDDFEKFVSKLKEYSNDKRPIWDVWNEDVERRRLQTEREKQSAWQARIDAKRAEEQAAQSRRDEMRSSIR